MTGFEWSVLIVGAAIVVLALFLPSAHGFHSEDEDEE